MNTAGWQPRKGSLKDTVVNHTKFILSKCTVRVEVSLARMKNFATIETKVDCT